ncbi:Zinc finger, RING/FYVE/PHD-type [Cynara cardunculus var. scolymus]|uniref:Zinc finger, RING/FYVE/PHD-type n=1 Tax=Cynara cardunculus var. scolymus TaxID=59895 RepID=A0A124SAY3_CYNCS|nr:Zinc finger, RING/FYVE/PHD-type [Cynara cardunculus var. scolymus]
MDMVYYPHGRCSYEESLKVLEADIQHANALAAAIPRAKDGARFQMKLVYNELAPLVMFLLQWIDSSCTCLLPRYLNPVHVRVYKVFADGRPKISRHGRKATINDFYAVILPSLRRLHCDLVELDYPSGGGSKGANSRTEISDQKKPETEICFTNLDVERENECGICLEPCTKIVLPNCCHAMCINCYRDCFAPKTEVLRLPVRMKLQFKGFQANTRIYASKSSPKKLRKAKEVQKLVRPQLIEGPPDEPDGLAEKSSPTGSINNLESQASIAIASRSSVLQACTVTSVNFEMWHLQVVAGLVILISSSRFLLLKTWSDFAESSEASNQQVLTSLEPLDYALVAFLPGISENAMAVAALFGILHLGSGRKFSFAIWATFVGLAYGYATIISSSLIVPMASHAINNLIGGVIWRVTHESHHQKREV